MKQKKKYWASFIPRHVSNHIFLMIYHFTSLISIPRKIRDRNYKSNIIQLKSMHWDFWTVPSAYIENQNEWSNIMYGIGKHHNMKYSGCEIIATFNALKALIGVGSPESMAELIREYEMHGAALGGEFGVSPRAIEAFFRKQSFLVTVTDKGDAEALEMVDRRSQVLIAVAYNDANDITQQVHTICITKDVGKGYVLHNAYRADQHGKYIASAPYVTLSDAIGNMSKYEPKLIYLIGIAGTM